MALITVEATHFRQTIFRSDLHFSHGMGEEIDRLVFDLSQIYEGALSGQFLVAYFWEGHLGAYFLENGKELSKAGLLKVRKVAVPHDIFWAAHQLADIQKQAQKMQFEERFAQLTNG